MLLHVFAQLVRGWMASDSRSPGVAEATDDWMAIPISLSKIFVTLGVVDAARALIKSFVLECASGRKQCAAVRRTCANVRQKLRATRLRMTECRLQLKQERLGQPSSPALPPAHGHDGDQQSDLTEVVVPRAFSRLKADSKTDQAADCLVSLTPNAK